MSVRRDAPSRLRATLWFAPAAGTTVVGVVTALLLRLRPVPGSALAELGWPGTASTASTMLQLVATSAITAATLTFSLTVIALQLSSQQFSPRLLRDVSRDRLIQGSMGVLVATFVAAVLTLRGLDARRPLPSVALAFVFLLALASAGAVIGFVGHLVRMLRVDTLMVRVHQQTRDTVGQTYPPYDDGAPVTVHPELPGPDGGMLVPVPRSGFVRVVEPAPLVEIARRHDLFVRIGVRPGDQVVRGTPLAAVWSRTGVARGAPKPDPSAPDTSALDTSALARELLGGVSLGYERTEDQDVAFGFRRLVDLALKAISPAVNDPTTAAESMGYCADLLVGLMGRRLGPDLHCDDDGVPRVVTADRDIRYYLDLACAQLRRSGRGDPTVLTALLRLHRDCALAARDAEQRLAVAHQIDLVEQQVAALPAQELLPEDIDAVYDMIRRARLALAGEVARAYADRAGETRSF